MSASPLNLLWVCTDSQRWDTLGCYGNPWVNTPNIDKLAAEGLQCNYAFAQNPLCQPSRGSFLTGRYPSTTRLRQNGQPCPTDLRLIPAMLRDAGYRCGLSGKLHLHACDRRYSLGERWWEHDRSHWSIGREPRINDGYTDFQWDHAARLNDPHSDYAAWLRQRNIDPTAPSPRSDCQHVLEGLPAKHRQATWCMDHAIRFIRDRAADHVPWMYSVNCFDPHYPFDPPTDALDRLAARSHNIPRPIPPLPDESTQLTAAHRSYREKFADRTPSDHRITRLAYWAMCELIDEQMGRLLDALRDSGQLDRTIVVFMSDHGEMLGDHGMYIKGPVLLEPAIRVPLILRVPGMMSPGRQTDHLVELTDLVPTFLDLLEQPSAPGVQGKSFASHIRDARQPPHRDSVYCEYHNSNPTRPPSYQSMVRTETTKLIVHHGQAVSELYDLRSDPTETTNLWHEPSATALRDEMVPRLLDRMAWTADPLPPRIGAF